MGALLWLGFAVGLACALAHAVYVFGCASTASQHFRNYPLTGHNADIAEATRLTQSGR